VFYYPLIHILFYGYFYGIDTFIIAFFLVPNFFYGLFWRYYLLWLWIAERNARFLMDLGSLGVDFIEIEDIVLEI